MTYLNGTQTLCNISLIWNVSSELKLTYKTKSSLRTYQAEASLIEVVSLIMNCVDT